MDARRSHFGLVCGWCGVWSVQGETADHNDEDVPVRLPTPTSTRAMYLRTLAADALTVGNVPFAATCLDLAGADDALVRLVRTDWAPSPLSVLRLPLPHVRVCMMGSRVPFRSSFHCLGQHPRKRWTNFGPVRRT